MRTLGVVCLFAGILCLLVNVLIGQAIGARHDLWSYGISFVDDKLITLGHSDRLVSVDADLLLPELRIILVVITPRWHLFTQSRRQCVCRQRRITARRYAKPG